MSTEGVPASPRSDALATAVRRARADWRRFVAPAAVGLSVLVILVAGGLTTAEFLTVDNLLIIVRTASITGIVALGMTFVTLTGNFFSLSLEQTAAMCSIVFAEALAHEYGLWLALLLAPGRRRSRSASARGSSSRQG